MSGNRRIKLRNGQGTIIRDGTRLEVRFRRLDIDYNIPLACITGCRGDTDIIKFVVDYLGVTYVDPNFTIDVSQCNFEHYKRNSTLLVSKTDFGPLFIKKIRQLPSCNCEFINNKYNILARFQGTIKLSNDVTGYNFGMILEHCYPPNINFTNFVDAVCDLYYMHKEEPNALHGDVNPSNIMSNSEGRIKLVDPVCILEGQVNIANVEYEDLTQLDEMRVFIRSLTELLAKQMGSPFEEIRVDYSGMVPIFSLERGELASDVITFDVQDIMSWKSRLLEPRSRPLDVHLFNDEYYRTTTLDIHVDLDDDEY